MRLAPGKMSGMVNEGNIGFTLPAGATGFFRPKDGPLQGLTCRRSVPLCVPLPASPEAKWARWRNRHAPGPSTPQRSSHAQARTSSCGTLITPWIAFAQTRRDWCGGEFLAPPPWAHAFTNAGFVVLSSEQLATPLSNVDTPVLTGRVA